MLFQCAAAVLSFMNQMINADNFELVSLATMVITTGNAGNASSKRKDLTRFARIPT